MRFAQVFSILFAPAAILSSFSGQSQSVSSASVTTGTPAFQLQTQQKDVAPSCGIKLLLQNQTIYNTCGLTIDQFGQIINQNLTFLKENEYFQLCTPGCQDTFRKVKEIVTSDQCKGEVFDKNANLTGTLLGSYLEIGTNVLCIKTQDQNGYCLYEQLPTLLPVLNNLKTTGDILKTLITNNTVACNDCIKREIAAIAPLNLPDFSPSILNAIKTFNDNYGIICLFGTKTITTDPFNFVPLVVPTTTSSTAFTTDTLVARNSAHQKYSLIMTGFVFFLAALIAI